MKIESEDAKDLELDVKGPAEVTAGEIRAGACLMIAGLMATGTTIIDKAGNILRGYDRVEEKLRQLGADVSIKDNPSVPGILDNI